MVVVHHHGKVFVIICAAEHLHIGAPLFGVAGDDVVRVVKVDGGGGVVCVGHVGGARVGWCG